MSFISDIFSGSLQPLVSTVSNVIDNLHTSDEEKSAAKLELEKVLQADRMANLNALETEMNAKKDVLVAELNQGDLYTKRARPTVVYVGLGMMILNEIVLPWVLQFLLLSGESIPDEILTMMKDPPALSGFFYTAWGGITGSWAIGRSVEKVKGPNKITDILQKPAGIFGG